MDKNIERILQSPIMKLASENQVRLESLSINSIIPRIPEYQNMNILVQLLVSQVRLFKNLA